MKSGLSSSTVQRIRMILVKALRHAERRDLVHRNVAALTDYVAQRAAKGGHSRQNRRDNYSRLLRIDHLGITVQLGLYLGLRPGEVLGLQWSDIDFHERTLTVQRSLKRENNQLRLRTTENTRIQFAPSRCLNHSRPLFSQHKSEQDDRREIAGELWHEFDLVVATEIRHPRRPQ